MGKEKDMRTYPSGSPPFFLLNHLLSNSINVFLSTFLVSTLKVRLESILLIYFKYIQHQKSI